MPILSRGKRLATETKPGVSFVRRFKDLVFYRVGTRYVVSHGKVTETLWEGVEGEPFFQVLRADDEVVIWLTGSYETHTCTYREEGGAWVGTKLTVRGTFWPFGDRFVRHVSGALWLNDGKCVWAGNVDRVATGGHGFSWSSGDEIWCIGPHDVAERVHGDVHPDECDWGDIDFMWSRSGTRMRWTGEPFWRVMCGVGEESTNLGNGYVWDDGFIGPLNPDKGRVITFVRGQSIWMGTGDVSQMVCTEPDDEGRGATHFYELILKRDH